MCVAVDNGKFLVVRDGRHYVFPDSVLHGKLEWNRSDAKRLAVKLLEHVTKGVMTGDAQVSDKVFGMKETHRAVSVQSSLDSLFPVLERVLKHRVRHAEPTLDVRLVTVSDIDILSIESAHVLRHFLQ